MGFLLTLAAGGIALIIASLIIRFSEKQQKKSKHFKVSYTLVIYDQNGERYETEIRRRVCARTSDEAITKIEQELSIISDRETMDLGMASREYRDFSAE